MLIFLLIAFAGGAQISNVRSLEVVMTTDTFRLDTLSIFPGSLEIFLKDEKMDPASYSVDYVHSTVAFNTPVKGLLLRFNYKVLPSDLSKSYRHKSDDWISPEYVDRYKPFVIGQSGQQESIFDDKGIQKNGSISRGILFGNNQNLSVNSTLNLQLSGKISERYSILASVTDDNIPVQPEGNTQQLQDFDQVFIQVYDEKTKLIAGDFQLKRPKGYFMNYFKRAQGAYVRNTSRPNGNENSNLAVEASASVSKGRFARNVIQGLEGNQGPYRLQGADNEVFIIVLAGTEQVFIDGRLLQRGQDKDYIIDYNAAEIVFTPRQLITKDRRIVVEFQYSDKRYARPLLNTSVVYEGKDKVFFLNAYSEGDAKNQPLQQELSDEQKTILALSGDNLLSAYSSGIDSVGYSNSRVLYAMVDSLGFDSVFVYSTDSASALYRLSFSFVGSGNGNYVEDGFTANGRKYKWVEPLLQNGLLKPQGNYEPIILLAAPKKNQMISAGMEIKLGSRRNHEVKWEGALSNRDLNTFSDRDNNDNLGYALKTTYIWKSRSFGAQTDSLSEKMNNVSVDVDYEYTARNFSQIERFREVEFARNWNIQNLSLSSDQHIAGAMFSIQRKNFGLVSAGGDVLQFGSGYNGYRSRLTTNIATKKKLKVVINASYLQSSGILRSAFLRHRGNLSKEFGMLRAYYRDEHEHNLLYAGAGDSLASSSYQFYDWEAGLGNADTTRFALNVFYRDRFDRKPLTNSLDPAARAGHYGFNAGYRGQQGNRLNLTLANRQLKVINPELFTQSPENTLLYRLDYFFKALDGFVQNTGFYEIGSGLEQRREFIYLEVPAGQGVYVWNDYDADGVRDLNEFEIAQFAYEANFIRSFVQSNDYIKTYSAQFSQSLNLNPARIIPQKKKAGKFFARFTDNASFRIDRKTTREEENERYNPFITSVADSSLLALNSMLRNALFFNKANPVFGMDYTRQFARNKSLLSNGFESRGDVYDQLGLRWNFLRDLTFFVDARKGKKSVSSDFLSGRNYSLDYYSVQPRITWQPDNTFRINLMAQYAEKVNLLGTEKGLIRKLGSDLTWNTVEKGSIRAEVNFYSIEYNGEGQNSLSFDVLEGLTTGYNFTWSAGVQRTVARNLQVNLLYNGRKPEELRAIHSASVQLRAIF